MSHFLRPQVLLLKEGTDTSQGTPQLVSNINACLAVVDIVKTTLGPRGMDKLIQTNNNMTITNDGATVLNLLEIEHPAAEVLSDIAKSQDLEIGDGTTSVVILAGEFMKEAKQFLEDGMHPSVIIKGYRKACQLARDKLREISIKISQDEKQNKTDVLTKLASTALNSKLVSTSKHFFAKMIVNAVEKLDTELERSLVAVKQVSGGSVTTSFLVEGVAFKKTFSQAGFEQQPKHFENAKILSLNVELELRSEKENAEIRIQDSNDQQSIVDAEWRIIQEKLENCVKLGANIILSKLPIGDLATQYFADRNIFCAGRVKEDDLRRVTKAVGGIIQSTCNNLTENVLGQCGDFEERQVGAERWNLFTKCPGTKTATIILRGGAEQQISETERSLNDAIQIVRRAIKYPDIVAGGGAIEMELSRFLRDYSRTVQGKQHTIINSYAKALEVIPKTLCQNGGLDAIDILNKLRMKHYTGSEFRWQGVNFDSGINDNYKELVWEPVIMKLNAINAATEAACLILSIDETIRAPKSEQPVSGQKRPAGRGRGMR